MQKRSRKAADVNEIAHAMVEAISSGDVPPTMQTADGKNPFAVALGRRGGLKGGPARAAKMTEKERSDSAKKAAQARWADRG
jgi:hypothetical protein